MSLVHKTISDEEGFEAEWWIYAKVNECRLVDSHRQRYGIARRNFLRGYRQRCEVGWILRETHIY